MEEKKRTSGIDLIGDTPWGTHFCQFYETKEDLIDILVPYFKAGLESNEFCMWITAEPLDSNSAILALRKEVKDLDRYIEKGQIEILDYSQWYIRSGEFDSDEVLSGWIEKEKAALEKGFDGLRLTGNTFWLEEKDWNDFTDYEEAVNNVIHNYQMLAICCYSISNCSASDIIDVVSNHQFALIRKEETWELMESSERKLAEETLREKTEYLENLINYANAPIIVWDPGFRITRFNHGFERLTGRVADEVVGRTFDILFPPDSREESMNLIHKTLAGERWEVVEIPILHVDGSVRTVLWNSASIYAAAGKAITATVAQGQDITERKRAEEALRESEEKYRSLVESSEDPIYLVDKDLQFLFANEKYLSRLGKSQDEVISQGYAEFHSPEQVKEFTQKSEEVFKSSKPVDYEHKSLRDNRDFLRTLSSVIDPITGRPTAVTVISKDITERKRAEEALRESEEKYRTFFKYDLTGDYVTTPEGEVIDCNPAFLEIFGLSSLEEARSIGIELLYPTPADRQKMLAKIKQEKIITNYEHEMRKVSGETIVVSRNVVGEFDEHNKLIQVRGYIIDITERKRAEEALRTSEEKYRRLFETMQDGVLIADAVSGEIIDVNPYLTELFKCNREAIIGKIVWKAHPFSSMLGMEEGFKSLRREGYTRFVTAYQSIPDGRKIFAEFINNVYLIGGRSVIQCNVRDITENKLAEKALRESEEKYRSLVESSEDPIYLVDKDLQFLFANAKYLARLGKSRDEVTGQGYAEFHSPEQVKEFAQKSEGVFKSSKPVVYEHKSLRDNRDFLRTLSPVIDPTTGRPTALTAISKDITERRQAEEEIKRRNEELAALNAIAAVVSQSLNLDEILNAGLDKVLEVMHLNVGGIYLTDPERRRLDLVAHRGISKEFSHEIGTVSVDDKSLEAVVAEGKLRKFILSVEAVFRDRVELKRIVSALKKEGLSLTYAVPVLLQAKGKIHGLLTVASRTPRQLSKAELELLASISQQITVAIVNAQLYKAAKQEISERKRAEQEIRRHTEDLTLLNTLNTAVNKGASLREVIILISKETERIFSGSDYGAFIHLLSEDRELLVATYIPLADGLANKLQLLLGMKIPELVIPRREGSIHWQVLESRKPLLTRDEKTFRKQITDYINETNVPNAIMRKSIRKLIPNIRKLLKIDSTILMPLGSGDRLIGLLSLSSMEELTKGDVERLKVLAEEFTSITRHKQAEEALKESEKKYRNLADNALVGIFTTDIKGNILYVNEALVRMLEFESPEEMVSKNVLTRYKHPEDRETLLERLKQGNPVDNFEVELLAKTNKAVNVLLSAVLDGDFLSGMIMNVTERKEAEEALRKSEEKYRQLFATVADAIVIYDAQTWQFIDVNQRAVDLYGYSREEFLQMIQLDISAEPEASELSIKETLAGYRVHVSPQYHKKKDGTVFPVEISRGVYTFGEQKVVCSVIRDITKRKRAEEELRESREQLRSLSAHLQSVREESQKLLAREIHDELGQNLTALKMDLSWLKGKLRKDQIPLEEKATAMTNLTDSMTQTVKRIATQLRPALLDDLGVVAALEWEQEEFTKHTGIRCDLTVEPDEIDLDPDRSTAVYRIFQEALTNIARHARATNAKASLKVHAGMLEMEIRDDGIGIAKEQIASPQSFGLIGMRERVLQWGGEAVIKGIKGRGTTLTVTIPLDNGENHNDQRPGC